MDQQLQHKHKILRAEIIDRIAMLDGGLASAGARSAGVQASLTRRRTWVRRASPWAEATRLPSEHRYAMTSASFKVRRIGKFSHQDLPGFCDGSGEGCDGSCDGFFGLASC